MISRQKKGITQGIRTYHMTYNRVFPLELVEEAARILQVNPGILISRKEYDGQPWK